jgi:hypothetical protein
MLTVSEILLRVRALRVFLCFSILSTGTHYTHNFVRMDDYPGSGPAVKLAIVLSWPLLTAIGLYGYRLYAVGRFREAHICLLLYAPLGLLTPAHFLYGEPDIPAFFYATIFTDGVAGLAIVGFVAWSATRAARKDGDVVARHEAERWLGETGATDG